DGSRCRFFVTWLRHGVGEAAFGQTGAAAGRCAASKRDGPRGTGWERCEGGTACGRDGRVRLEGAAADITVRSQCIFGPWRARAGLMKWLLLLAAAWQAHSADVCEPAKLQGAYGVQLSGDTTISGRATPVAAIGRLV